MLVFLYLTAVSVYNSVEKAKLRLDNKIHKNK